ncbi:MAG: pyrimidine-nucleoside phosphorylase, partial [Eubacteriales bacterium]|nr:pyrimidine-nucleoside phosphorylase [Eubacteriales bacterium]
MRMYDVIMRKRNGESLTTEEINEFVKGYTDGSIPDYQVSALMMAIYFNKMNYRETFDLTMAMAKSGDMLDLSAVSGIKCDKHSTGGVGDKTSLVLAPMVAAVGGKIAKMSGRGLGHTGGTIDKLESFAGLNTSLSEDAFIKQVNDIGFAITGQTGNLAPADKKLYALRDVTATVDNLSLIASSIMSKKIAAGADVIVLDVKCGSGAFMKNESDAFALGEEMVRIGNTAGRKTIAVITEMDQPLGYAVGNTLEVKEAVETLKGNGPEDLYELCLTLGAYMVTESGLYKSAKEARSALIDAVESGKALDKLAEFVKCQGGNPSQVYDTSTMPKSNIIRNVFLDLQDNNEKLSDDNRTYYVSHIKSDEVGNASRILGGGRATKEDIIDLSVGVILHKKVGDILNINEPVATVYGNNEENVSTAIDVLKEAY